MGTYVTEISDCRDGETLVVPPILREEVPGVTVTGKAKAFLICHFGAYVREEGLACIHCLDASNSLRVFAYGQEEQVIGKAPGLHTVLLHETEPWFTEQCHH